MTSFTKEIEINASKGKVWAALANVGDICHAHPSVLTSNLTSTQSVGVGTTRHCNFTMMGATSEERVTVWIEGESMTIEAYELKRLPGIKSMIVKFSVRENGNNSILTTTMEYTMKNPLFSLMNQLVMKKMNEKLLNGIVAGHKKYIEEGEIVTQKTVLALNKVVTIK